MRITGMVSGMDTDTLIRDLMKAERAPLDRLQAKKVTLGWQQDAFRNINNKFLELRTLTQDLRFTGNFRKYAITSSNEQAVKVQNTGTTQAGTQYINSIDKLASFGSAIGTSVNSIQKLEGTDLASSTAYDSAANAINVTATNNSFVMELGGVSKTITLEDASYTIGQSGTLKQKLQEKIDQAFGAGKVTVGFDSTDQKLTFIPSGATGFEPQLKVRSSGSSTLVKDLGFQENQSYKASGTSTLADLQSRLGASAFTFTTDTTTNTDFLSFQINGVSFKANSTDTVDSLMKQVNDSAAGVTMSFDEQSGKFSFMTKTTGSNSQINFSNDANLFIQKIGITGTSYSGTDAEFTMNGVKTQRNSNTFTENGVTYTLLQTTTSPISINTQQDTNQIYDKIKSFVDKYNEIVSEVSTKLVEKKYRDFPPLTDDQKKDMKEKEIELWEEKAKSGLLRNESILSTARDGMRRLLNDPVQGLTGFKTLGEIGITTSKNYKENGKLEIDEGKLKDAIANNLDQVIALFTTKVDDSNTSNDGFAQRLYEKLNTTIDQINKKAGFTSSLSIDSSLIGKEITRISDQINTWEDKLVRKEDYYYKQFAAMEKALSQMNSQSSWLLNQFGAGTQ